MNWLRLVSLAAVMAVSTAGARSPVVAAAPLSIDIVAVVAETPFQCGRSYPGIGTTRSTMAISELKFFVSQVRVVGSDGRETPVTLTQDGVWQNGDVALLDFEDGTGDCSNGTPETRRVVQGTVPAEGSYVGLRFDLGLPFDVNHRDPTLQPSPLNLTRMFWNWNGGYKFVRIDLKSTGQPRGSAVHLGSTGCTPRQGPTTVPVQCANENRASIVLPAFDAARQVVQFDLAALLANTNLDVNAPDTPAGCMATTSDPDCAGIFAALGLPFGATARPVAQRVFTAVARGGLTASPGRRR
jgi:uncharacterized repeat protein (TIGR04052 family)